ncbi:ABC transporter ATP-binding protein [Streptomyces sp. NPDC004296]|uniref:ABC transporter ATP-binding protein n=1 Tax=Streptomyces sp. NPDC004296 TaxID=3364697 RepID=UPI0036BEF405
MGRRYQRGWALKDCSFRLSAGRVCALVGPNGAGKSTLLATAADLLEPTEGTIKIFGQAPGTPDTRRRVAFVPQDKPLHPSFTVEETLRMGRALNPGWDQATAERIVREGDIPFHHRVRALSGGQRTRVALALGFGKQPELLLLDEPMADLDPLVRHEMLAVLMAEVADHGTTVILSSHVVTELEEACDHLLLLNTGRIQLAGDIDDLLGAHRWLTGAAPATTAAPSELERHTVVECRTTGRQLKALIRPDGPVSENWHTSRPTLEELILAHLRSPDAPPLLAAGARPRKEAA